MTDNYQIYISNVAVWSIIIYVFFLLFITTTVLLLYCLKKNVCKLFLIFRANIHVCCASLSRLKI